jgi:hypothetical protein
MLTPERLLRVSIEMIFVLLGALVTWLVVRGRISVDRHGKAWLILSLVLILWGLRVVYKPELWWARLETWMRGLSFVLLGILMLVITRVPFSWVGPMLAAGGAILMVRGVVVSTVLFRHR